MGSHHPSGGNHLAVLFRASFLTMGSPQGLARSLLASGVRELKSEDGLGLSFPCKSSINQQGGSDDEFASSFLDG